MKIKAALLVLALALAACSAETGDRETVDRHTADPETAAGTQDRETIFDPMTEAIDDAKAVEDKVMQQKADIDAALEEAEESADE